MVEHSAVISKSHNSFLWRPLTAPGHPHLPCFLSPMCPQRESASADRLNSAVVSTLLHTLKLTTPSLPSLALTGLVTLTTYLISATASFRRLHTRDAQIRILSQQLRNL